MDQFGSLSRTGKLSKKTPEFLNYCCTYIVKDNFCIQKLSQGLGGTLKYHIPLP